MSESSGSHTNPTEQERGTACRNGMYPCGCYLVRAVRRQGGQLGRTVSTKAIGAVPAPRESLSRKHDKLAPGESSVTRRHLMPTGRSLLARCTDWWAS